MHVDHLHREIFHAKSWEIRPLCNKYVLVSIYMNLLTYYCSPFNKHFQSTHLLADPNLSWYPSGYTTLKQRQFNVGSKSWRTQRWNNINSTLIQRLDVESTLYRYCFKVVRVLGMSVYVNLFIYVLSKQFIPDQGPQNAAFDQGIHC